MIIRVSAKAVMAGTAPKLIFSGFGVWDDWDHEYDLAFCIHGEKLRWTCDDCDEYFIKNPKHRPVDTPDAE